MNAIFGFLTSVTNLFAADKEARWGRLPDWMTAKDFQKSRDNTLLYVILGLLFLLIVMIAASVAAARK